MTLHRKSLTCQIFFLLLFLPPFVVAKITVDIGGMMNEEEKKYFSLSVLNMEDFVLNSDEDTNIFYCLSCSREWTASFCIDSCSSCGNEYLRHKRYCTEKIPSISVLFEDEDILLWEEVALDEDGNYYIYGYRFPKNTSFISRNIIDYDNNIIHLVDGTIDNLAY